MGFVIPEENLYRILNVSIGCTFEELRASYRKLAKECHPDLFGNDPAKTAAFQRLVHAFDILSDPETRDAYNRRLAAEEPALPGESLRSNSVMDTVADDILEELLVGHEVHRITSLQTLMLDLARTERFIQFRQAKDYYAQQKYHRCASLCSRLIDMSPGNILYHFYYAEASRHLHRYSRASRHYRICLELGSQRNPPQLLRRVRRKYRSIQDKRGWFAKFLAFFFPVEEAPPPSDEDQMRNALESAFAKDAEVRRKRACRHLEHKGRKRLTE